jgi:exosortase
LLFSLQELWSNHPAYHFVPLPLAALLWFLFKDSRRLPIALAYRRASAWLAVVHVLLALAAFVLVSPFIAGIAFCVAMLVYALACERSGYEDAPRWSFPALALFFVPPPLMLDSDLHQILAGLAARLSQGWLDAVNVLHVVEGTIVATPEKRFFVDDACSGTNSMMVAVCVALIIGSLRRRSW